MANHLEKGLSYHNIALKDNVIIDADNAFWVIPHTNEQGNPTISRKALSLYEDIRDDLDTQMNDFRFGANLTALYIDPTDRCNANCPYCYVPQGIRRNGRSMTGDELTSILRKIAGYFGGRERKNCVIVFHASEPLLVKDVVFKAIERFGAQFKFGLQTNAILLKKDDVEFLKRHRVGVGISLDSLPQKLDLQTCREET